jgi:nucleotide-sensitive chloride channel 1A
MEVIHDAPVLTNFVLLADHQAQTPSSFYTGPPVLYYRCTGASLSILRSDLESSPALSKLNAPATGATSNALANGRSNGTHEDDEVVITNLDCWVSSEYV